MKPRRAWGLAPLMLIAVAHGEDPTALMNSAKTVPDLGKQLHAVASKKDEDSIRAFLWGSLLYEGCRSKATRFPTDLLAAGDTMAKATVKRPGTMALQLWWFYAIEDKYGVPDFKKAKIKGWTTINVMGHKEKRPILYFPSEFEAAAAKKKLSVQLHNSDSHDDALLMYRWWYKDPKRPVTDQEIELVANDPKSAFRVFGVAELAIREQLDGQPGKWVNLWEKTKAAKVQSLALRTLIVREREKTKPVK